MTKNNSRIIVFTSSNKNTSEEEYKEALLKLIQIHFDGWKKRYRI